MVGGAAQHTAQPPPASLGAAAGLCFFFPAWTAAHVPQGEALPNTLTLHALHHHQSDIEQEK